MIHIDAPIEGMSRNYCAMAVRKELQRSEIRDLRVVADSLEYDEARVKTEHVKAAIEEAGYPVVG